MRKMKIFGRMYVFSYDLNIQDYFSFIRFMLPSCNLPPQFILCVLLQVAIHIKALPYMGLTYTPH